MLLRIFELGGANSMLAHAASLQGMLDTVAVLPLRLARNWWILYAAAMFLSQSTCCHPGTAIVEQHS